ncbi:MAG TPA: hypothetical protein VHU41_16655, partial [Thermoanaerobaculia bacterium]|nr:hypothetical protein [Thermoanaerobaculia bacterium]
MRGCVVAVLTVLFLSSSPLAAQCNSSLVYSGPFRASYLDLAIDGNDLWVATSYGVQLFDRSVDPPALVASISVPGITRVVRAVNGVAYAGSGSSVYVIHRSGKTLTVAATYDAGATVNDLVVTAAQFGFIATANGLRQVDFFNLSAPFVPLQTTGANVTSLATDTTLSTLYAADGDSSIEMFNISVPNSPQHTGSLSSLPRVTSVQTTPTRLYASDGISTDVFVNGSKAATVSKGTLTLATVNGDVVFAAGNDRHIRAADWTTITTPVELFGTDIVPTGGAINRVGAMRIAGGRLYVAAGDAGLLTFDVSSMAAPFPVRSYLDTPMTSTFWVDGKLYASRSGGGLAEYVKSTNGYLTSARQWDARTHTIYDGANGFLLTASGTTLFYWTLASTTPVLITSATLRAGVISATAINGAAYVVLSDNSVWSVDMTSLAPVPQQIANAKATTIAHAGTLIGTTYDPGDGTTTITFYTKSDMSDPSALTIAGSSTTPLTMSGNTAAVFTFSGISLIDATSRAVTTIPGSNSAIARRLVLGGSRVFELTSNALLIWDLATKKLTRTMALPTDATSLSIDTIAAMGTATGVETAAFDSTEAPPALLATRNNNTYYKKVVAGLDRVYLFGPNGIDAFETRYGFTPHYLTSFSAAGILDVAANDAALYTVSNSNVVTAYSREGGVLAQTTLDASSQPLAIVAAGNAVWLAVTRGCTTGGCEKKTLVLDPRTLANTATLDGGVVDATTNGASVYAVFDLPSEVRLYDTSNPAAPVLTRSVVAGGATTPVSIALSNNNVYVAGDQLYSYDLQLAQRTDTPPAFQADPVAGFAFKDQRVASLGTCLLVSRSAQPQWSSVPAVIRSVAQTAGTLYLLTDDSLE